MSSPNPSNQQQQQEPTQSGLQGPEACLEEKRGLPRQSPGGMVGLERGSTGPLSPRTPREEERPPQGVGKAKARPRRTPPCPQKSKAMDEGGRDNRK